MDDDRARTLRTLVELAEENSPNACWDDRRAVRLLRAQATAEELRELGVSDATIDHIFSERNVC